MSRCGAWLLNLAGGRQAVIGQRELLHLVQQPETHEVPCAPAHCRKVLLWEQAALPVLDVGRWADPTTASPEQPVIAVVGFYSDDVSDTPQFGALVMTSAPQLIQVDDAAACELPAELEVWRRISCACVERDGRPMPVLDLRQLFNQNLS